jgi:predicted nucleic acid-binding protein
MITCDTNVLIDALDALTNKASRREPRIAASLHIFRTRRTLGLRVPETVAAEVLLGQQSRTTGDYALAMLGRLTVIPTSALTTRMGVRLRRSLGKSTRSNHDCIIYAEASNAGSAHHLSWDRGLVGATNRTTIPRVYKKLFHADGAELETPLEYIMPKRNPPLIPNERFDRQRARRCAAVRELAHRRARRAGCRDAIEENLYMCAVFRAAMSARKAR